MKALRFDGRVIREIAAPVPRRARGEALVRVRLAGICSTDLEIARGYLSFRGVPGHEFVGTVVRASSRSLLGRRVVGEINAGCGVCSWCKTGVPKHCPERSVLGIDRRNGAFAEYLVIPERSLHVVPDRLDDEEAAFAEPLAAACEITERTRIGRGDRVLVLGDGRLAALAAQVVSLETRRVDVLGKNARKLAVIRSLGIRAHGPGDDMPAGRRYDVVVECTGSPTGLPLAASLVRPQGTIVLKSTYEASLAWNPAPLVIDEITVVGSRCGPFGRALRLLAAGKIRVKPLLTAVYPFERWEAALRRARRADSFKVLVRME